MTDALIAVVETIRDKHGIFPIDAVALSLSNEFLARAAADHPTYFRSLGLIAPTGFDSKREVEGPAGETYGNASARDVVSFPAWGRSLFDALTSRVSIRFFLQKTFGSKRIDEGLFRYAYASAHQPDAEHAPFSFLSGFLFSKDALTLFKSLAMPVWMAHGVRGDFVDLPPQDRGRGAAELDDPGVRDRRHAALRAARRGHRRLRCLPRQGIRLMGFSNRPLDFERDGQDWPNRDVSRFVRAAGIDWHVQEIGDPALPVALLLQHGTGAATHSWRGLVPLLTPAVPPRRARPAGGNGFTQRPSVGPCSGCPAWPTACAS